jgi:hypothetical protein
VWDFCRDRLQVNECRTAIRRATGCFCASPSSTTTMECRLLTVVRMLSDNEPKNTGAVANAPSAARRRLLRGGLATGPVLMTIASRPVLGQIVCTASASCSVIPANSLAHAHAHVCEEAAGLSPERWKAMAPDWPSPYIAVVAPVVQDPAPSNCTQTTAPAPTTTQTTTAPSAYETYRTRRTELYASRGLGTLTGTTTTTVTPTTATAPTTSTTCTTTAVAPASTPTATTPSAYDSYRTQRAQLYANRGLTGLVSNPPTTTTTTSTATTMPAPIAQPTSATTTTTSAPATTQTATASAYTYRTGTRSPYIRGTTSTAPPPTTGTTSTPTVTSGPTVGPAGTNGTPFHCPTTGLNGQTFGNRTMLDVLGASGGTYDALGRYTVAALLNAKSGRVHVLPESTVRNMWNDCVTRGYYEPAAGVKWGAAEIVAYMQKTIA